jgi:hypothetical protein
MPFVEGLLAKSCRDYSFLFLLCQRTMVNRLPRISSVSYVHAQLTASTISCREEHAEKEAGAERLFWRLGA